MHDREPKDWITLALDVPTRTQVEELIEQLAPHVGGFKVGLRLITAGIAHDAIARIRKTGRRIVLDGKLHDIPTTMRDAAAEAAQLGVDAITIHALAGVRGIAAAVAGVQGTTTRVIGVTVLTSHTPTECQDLLVRGPAIAVVDLARMLVRGGAHGIVCAPTELALLQQVAERGQYQVADQSEHRIDHEDARIDELHTMIPGIRPEWASEDDQERSMTPAEAIVADAQELVIGRPIRNPPPQIGSRIVAAQRIAADIAVGLAARGRGAS
ncbi:orotidine-5'-phosphate decarboxylase [Candidatus Uhrbacteria bacterium]|nr:orotidine-5'-phosphate decarboxylase [Candidatus Uhrbacteria bacterium]